MVLVKLRFLLKILNFVLKLFYFSVFFLLNRFELLLILFVLFIQDFGHIDFGDSGVLFFCENIFDKVVGIVLEPIQFGFLILLALENVFICFKTVFEAKLVGAILEVGFDFLFELANIMERLLKRVDLWRVDMILL